MSKEGGKKLATEQSMNDWRESQVSFCCCRCKYIGKTEQQAYSAKGEVDVARLRHGVCHIYSLQCFPVA